MPKVLLGITGSVSCELYDKLIKALSVDNDVKVVFTQKAVEMAKISLKKDSPYYSSKYHMFFCENHKEVTLHTEDNRIERYHNDKSNVLHIDLANWADKVVIAPASANTIGKLVGGIGDNLLTDTMLAYLGTGKPLYIAPAMNTNICKNVFVKENIDKLKYKRNAIIIEPTVKKLACGDFGFGALADIYAIVNIVNGHKWQYPLCITKDKLPNFDEMGAFGAVRKHDIHTGVDLYCHPLKFDFTEEYYFPVCAVEDGIVVDKGTFTGPSVNMPWWNETEYIVIKGKSGYVLYGEITDIEEYLEIGEEVDSGKLLAKVTNVLDKDKIRCDIRNHSNYMLHIELYKEWCKEDAWDAWIDKRPKRLADPTPYLRLM